MRYFVLGLLLWFVVLMPSSAESAEETHRIVSLATGIKDAMKNNEYWKSCGDYFAAGESTEGKIVHFIFERSMLGYSRETSAFVTMDRVVVSIDKKLKTPMVIILNGRMDTPFILKMNVEDYKAGLPCLAKGTKV
ncbi:MAG: hypothetical protein WCT41_02145 [Candidatus Paceibacterota bacterium]|jgi:hypothetical protein